MSGVRNSKKCPARCIEHMFSLKPLRHDLYYKYQTTLQLCSPYRIQGIEQTLYPEYNNDNKIYTPAFVLGVDKVDYIMNDQKYLTEHLKKVKDQSEKKVELLLPKPEKKQKYCGVCSTEYEDYLTHIQSKSHKSNIRNNLYNKQLLKISDQIFKNEPKKEIIVISDKEELVESTNFQIHRQQLHDNQPAIAKKLKIESIPKKYTPNFQQIQRKYDDQRPLNLNVPDYFRLVAENYTKTFQQIYKSTFVNPYFINPPLVYFNNMNAMPYGYMPFISFGNEINPIVLDDRT